MINYNQLDKRIQERIDKEVENRIQSFREAISGAFFWLSLSNDRENLKEGKQLRDHATRKCLEILLSDDPQQGWPPEIRSSAEALFVEGIFIKHVHSLPQTCQDFVKIGDLD